MRRRISIRGCVRPSVRPSVRRSVGPSVRPSVPRYFQTRTRRIWCRVSGLVSLKFCFKSVLKAKGTGKYERKNENFFCTEERQRNKIILRLRLNRRSVNMGSEQGDNFNRTKQEVDKRTRARKRACAKSVGTGQGL